MLEILGFLGKVCDICVLETRSKTIDRDCSSPENISYVIVCRLEEVVVGIIRIGVKIGENLIYVDESQSLVIPRHVAQTNCREVARLRVGMTIRYCFTR